MNFADFTIANEGFIFSDNEIERPELIRKGIPLLLFSSSNPTKYTGKLLRLVKKYGYDSFTVLNYEYLIEYINTPSKKLRDLVSTSPELITYVDWIIEAGVTPKTSYCDLLGGLKNMCSGFIKENGIYVIIQMDSYYAYSFRNSNEFPVMLFNPSYLRCLVAPGSMTPFADWKIADYVFNRALASKLSKKYFIKYSPSLKLYHVSRDPNLKVLEPRRTNRPLSIYENLRIPRISCAASLEDCLRGVQYHKPNDELGYKVYVYELILNRDSVIVKPDRYLVPDSTFTHEYWVLTKTPVKLIDTIQVTKDDTHGVDNWETEYDVWKYGDK